MMKKIKYLILLLAFVAGGFTTTATADDSDAAAQKIKAAVMKVYDEALAENPGDYGTRFARAMQHYYNGDLDMALSDVNTAIEQIPEKEKSQLYDALILRSKLYDAQGKYTAEQADLQRASELNASNLSGVDMKAKLALKQNDLQTAEDNFNAILRQSPQNYDALYGLAQVEVKRANYTKAQEYAERAVKLFPAEAQVYINRADVFNQMGQYAVAAQDLILAMSVGKENNRAIPALYVMADSHYDEVMDALQHSIDNAPRQGSFYFIRANIAKDHFHYGQALNSLNMIISNKFFEDASVYYDAALCQFHLAKFDAALASVNRSIAMDGSNVDAHVLKSKILRNIKGDKSKEILTTLTAGEKVNDKYAPLLIEHARFLNSKRKSDEAIAMLDKVIKADPTNNEALLMRGFINKYRLNDSEAALADFGMMLKNGKGMESLHGFALHELGRDDDARKWAQDQITSTTLPGGEAYAYASSLLSDIGDNDQAMKYLESALANGYGSYYEIKFNDDPYVNLRLVRRHPQFEDLVVRYASNFEEK